MRKKLCACGCGERVTRKVELHHMNALTPVVLASQVLDQNRMLIRWKKRSQAIGFPASFHQRLAMENATEVDNMDYDDNDVVLPDASDDEDFYVDHAGPSGLSHNDDPLTHDSPVMMEDLDGAEPLDLSHDHSLLPDPPYEDSFMDDPAPSAFPNDDASMGGNIDSEVYGLSNLRRSQRIADGVEKIGQQRWGSNAPVHFVNNREKSDEEEEDIDDDDPISDFNVTSDEEDEEDEDEMFARPGQEGISLWDSLGEGFLKEVSQLGICHSGIIVILKF
jgi:hypothetical protein